ncbi:dihydroneopterin aldolase [Xiashengella succiniciproducens]|jgi:dihydroneopterin aldolase|uniref:7,8-dihydroneopterin aldolase n=1 Tax=Xiashengella succiniciproducens TaxID=2949635 RepID=A0A9J6ZNZ8_9BACT|nr:dihydroneopterin aldolase [Alkaliflexus sp. Ai-910]URW79634.1 dihydroneopterin aldolase [Alkaliflexus sp. Ai-910]
MENQIATIELEEMVFYAYHGCFTEEKVVGNKFVVNVTIKHDISHARHSDRIQDTVNYVRIYEAVKKEMMVSSNLLEHVTGRIIDNLFDNFPSLTYAKIKVSKMNPPMGGQMKCVSLTLEKEKKAPL